MGFGGVISVLKRSLQKFSGNCFYIFTLDILCVFYLFFRKLKIDHPRKSLKCFEVQMLKKQFFVMQKLSSSKTRMSSSYYCTL